MVNSISRRLFIFKSTVISLSPTSVFGTEKILTRNLLSFPRDFGGHFDHEIEWWYVTGWIDRSINNSAAFQVTFFRKKINGEHKKNSSFELSQLVFAHASIILPEKNQIIFSQRSGRLRKEIIQIDKYDTNIKYQDWFLKRNDDNSYEVQVLDSKFKLNLSLFPKFNGPNYPSLILRGRGGLSMKGPSKGYSSMYYSKPNLLVTGKVEIPSRKWKVKGLAWLDHEWSNSLLASDAVGWDWIGVNLFDGGSLMAFRIRRSDQTTFWSNFSILDKYGNPHPLFSEINKLGKNNQSEEKKLNVRWKTVKIWNSPKSLAKYPVIQELHFGDNFFKFIPLIDNQEIDARFSTGGFYWEGAIELIYKKNLIGKGFLELTGYSSPLRLQ